ncbi:MAG: acetylxylan esterase, partial [Oligosphaeraceae bacterium]|nr:acetylxylan esterase [Oligosphaeraceae bacterium]
MHVQRLSIFFLVLLLTALLPAQEFKFEVKTDKEEAIYRKGEDIVFSLRLLKDAQAVAGRTISYTLIGDGNLRENGTFISSDTPYTVQSKLGFPGWVYIRCVLLDDNGKPVKFKNSSNREVEISGSIGAMVEPYEIRAAGQEPADFDAFWQRARAELSALPLEAKLEPMSRGANDDGK